jgi:DNA-binding NarL/FixJ family response regulator
MMERLRVVILDSNALSRNGLKALVTQAGVPVDRVQAFADVDSLRAHLERRPVHILILSDARPAGQDVLPLVRALRQTHPGVRQMVVSDRLNTDYIRRLLQIGAGGFVYRGGKLEQTISVALQIMGEGEAYLSPEAAALPYYQRPTPKALSARDLEALELLAQGQSTWDIARSLGVSRRVIYSTRARLKRYLGVANNEQIVSAALESGLLTEKSS